MSHDEPQAAMSPASSLSSTIVSAMGLAFASSGRPQWVCDRSSLQCLAVNDAALACYGHSREDFLAMTTLQLHAADERDAARAYLSRVDSLPPDLESRIWRHHTSAGEILVRMAATALTVGETSVLLMQPVDLTADTIRLREAEGREAAADKRGETTRRSAERLLTVVGHELRQPLAPIMTAVRVLESDIRSDEGTKALEVMTRQLSVLTRLVDDLFDTSQARQGTVTLEREARDLRRLVSEIAHDFAGPVSAHDLNLATSLPSSPVWASVDPSRIREVVSNLITNAIRYSPAGGCVQLRVTVGDDRCHLVVTDEGEGIAPDVLPHIFDLFSTTGHGSRECLGVGLSVVRTLVELHGGHVTAGNRGDGLGAEFAITLPTCAPPGW